MATMAGMEWQLAARVADPAVLGRIDAKSCNGRSPPGTIVFVYSKEC